MAVRLRLERVQKSIHFYISFCKGVRQCFQAPRTRGAPGPWPSGHFWNACKKSNYFHISCCKGVRQFVFRLRAPAGLRAHGHRATVGTRAKKVIFSISGLQRNAPNFVRLHVRARDLGPGTPAPDPEPRALGPGLGLQALAPGSGPGLQALGSATRAPAVWCQVLFPSAETQARVAQKTSLRAGPRGRARASGPGLGARPF